MLAFSTRSFSRLSDTSLCSQDSSFFVSIPTPNTLVIFWEGRATQLPQLGTVTRFNGWGRRLCFLEPSLLNLAGARKCHSPWSLPVTMCFLHPTHDSSKQPLAGVPSSFVRVYWVGRGSALKFRVCNWKGGKKRTIWLTEAAPHRASQHPSKSRNAYSTLRYEMVGRNDHRKSLLLNFLIKRNLRHYERRSCSFSPYSVASNDLYLFNLFHLS